LVGQAVGRKNMAEVRQITGAAVSLFILAGAATAFLGWLAAPALLKALAVPKEVLPLALDYMPIVFLSLPFSMLGMLIPALQRGIGDSISSLWNTVLNVALCLILNPLLIPQFGIKGAAYAGILANIASLIYLVSTVYRRDTPLALRGADLRFLRPHWGRAKPLVLLGLPLGLSMIIVAVSQLIVIGLVNREGMATVAGFGAVNQLWSFLQMPAFAISTAVSAMAAQNIGAGRWDRVNHVTWAGAGINTVMMAVVLLGMTLAETQLLGLFLPKGSKAIEIGAHINLMVGWTFILMGIGSVVTATVRSNGATMQPLIIQAFSGVVVRFAIAFPLYPIWGANAIWASFVGAAVATTLLSVAYYQWGNWRNLKPRSAVPPLPEAG
jgi:putative MATE family efflux protein